MVVQSGPPGTGYANQTGLTVTPKMCVMTRASAWVAVHQGPPSRGTAERDYPTISPSLGTDFLFYAFPNAEALANVGKSLRDKALPAPKATVFGSCRPLPAPLDLKCLGPVRPAAMNRPLLPTVPRAPRASALRCLATAFETTSAPSSTSIVSAATPPRSTRGTSTLSASQPRRAAKQPKIWLGVSRNLPRRDAPQGMRPYPPPAQREQVLGWADACSMRFARAHAGDPGPSSSAGSQTPNTPHYTIRDLTGVESLRPVRESHRHIPPRRDAMQVGTRSVSPRDGDWRRDSGMRVSRRRCDSRRPSSPRRGIAEKAQLNPSPHGE